MRYRTYVPQGLWQRTRWIRLAFIVGLVVGLILGWLFHGIISLVMKFGLVAILLLPIIIIGFLWWRASRRPSGRPMTVMTWRGGPSDPSGTVEDVPFTTADRPRTASSDVEAELDALRSARDHERREGRSL